MEALKRFAKPPENWTCDERADILSFAAYLAEIPDDVRGLVSNPPELYKSPHYDEVVRRLPSTENHLIRLATSANNIEFRELRDLACYKLYTLISGKPLGEILAAVGINKKSEQ